MENMTLLHVQNTYDNKVHIIYMSKHQTISELKFILAKRLLIHQDSVFIYKDKELNIEMNNIIGNNKKMFVYIIPVQNIEKENTSQKRSRYCKICCWRT